MTDHLESYRRMARSIRFFPPVSLNQPSQQPVAVPVTPESVDLSSKKTVPDADASAVSTPPIDPSEHIIALVQKAVQKPTVLPHSYTILENIGDRISRLTTPKPVPIILPKIPQPTSQSPSTFDSASESAIDPNHAATLIHEAVRQPTRLPDSYEILENIGDRISRLSSGRLVDSDSTATKIPQPETHSTSASSIEPQSSEADTKNSVDDTYPEAVTSATGVGEAPVVAETYSDDLGVDIKPTEETTDAAATAVVVESVADQEASSDDAVAVVQQPHQVEQTSNTSTDTAVVQPEDVSPTLLERVSSVIETVSTAFKNLDTKQQDDTETPTTDTVEPLVTADEAKEAPTEQSPNLLERVSSVVEAVTTAFKNPDAQHQDLETGEPSETTDVISETPTSSTTQTPTISQASPTVEAATPLKASEAVREPALAGSEAASDKIVEKSSSKSDSIEAEDQPTKQAAPTKTAKVDGSESDTHSSDSSSSAKRSSKRKTRGKGFGSSNGN